MTRSAAAEPLRIHLQRIEQLFNTLDPAPFHQRDLDADAEDFLVGWAMELPRQQALALVLELETPLHGDAGWVGPAIRNYFSGRAEAARLRLRRLLRKGRASLLIGGAFLMACLVLAHLLSSDGAESLWRGALRESLSIGGWVAMWQPLQIYLYDWWPLREQQALYRRMAGMTVELAPATGTARFLNTAA